MFGGEGIPFIQVNGTGVKLIQTIRPTNTTISPIGVGVIADARVWMREPPMKLSRFTRKKMVLLLFWTSEDFTAIDKAIVDGKKIYS